MYHTHSHSLEASHQQKKQHTASAAVAEQPTTGPNTPALPEPACPSKHSNAPAQPLPYCHTQRCYQGEWQATKLHAAAPAAVGIKRRAQLYTAEVLGKRNAHNHYGRHRGTTKLTRQAPNCMQPHPQQLVTSKQHRNVTLQRVPRNTLHHPINSLAGCVKRHHANIRHTTAMACRPTTPS
jgi:hypothetical protein